MTRCVHPPCQTASSNAEGCFSSLTENLGLRTRARRIPRRSSAFLRGCLDSSTISGRHLRRSSLIEKQKTSDTRARCSPSAGSSARSPGAHLALLLPFPGSGSGLVSICLAAILPACEDGHHQLLATDLGEPARKTRRERHSSDASLVLSAASALPLIDVNVQSNSDLFMGSLVQGRELDWDAPLPDWALEEEAALDLIMSVSRGSLL